MANITKFTPHVREKFLVSLRKNVNITIAARSVGVSRQTAYVHKHADSEFAADWDNAYQEAINEYKQKLYNLLKKPSLFESFTLIDTTLMPSITHLLIIPSPFKSDLS